MTQGSEGAGGGGGETSAGEGETGAEVEGISEVVATVAVAVGVWFSFYWQHVN